MNVVKYVGWRWALVLSLLGLSSVVTTAFGDVLTVETTGDVTSITQGTIPFDSSVYVGETFSETFSIDTNEPVAGSSAVGAAYGPLNGTGSITLGNYSFSAPATSVEVFSDSVDTPQSYGYDTKTIAIPPGGDSHGFSENEIQIVLISTTTPSAVPTTDLSSIHQVPLSDFDGAAYMELTEIPSSGTYSTVTSSITSYTVTTVPVPEPRQSALILLAGVLLLAFSRKLRCRPQP